MWLNRNSMWIDPIMVYLTDGTLPLNPKEKNMSKKRVKWFILYDEIFYMCPYTCPLYCCITHKQGQKILKVIYERLYSSHIGGCVLALTTLRTGYYQSSLRENDMAIRPWLEKVKSVKSFHQFKENPSSHLPQY